MKSPEGQPRQLFSGRTWGWILVGVAVLAAALFAASRWIEVVEETEWVGVKGEAATNPYLALERLLNVKGASTVKATRSDQFDLQLRKPEVGVLLLGANRLPSMSPERVAAIVAWVEQGGHLVMEAERPLFGDPLLTRWSIARKPFEPQSPQDYVVKPRVEARNRPLPIMPGQWVQPQAQATQIRLADGTTFKAIFYPLQNLMMSAPNASVEAAAKTGDTVDVARDRLGGRIVQLQVGSGRVTAISNFDFVQWKELGKADHAELIWHLLSGGGTKAGGQAATMLLMLQPSTTGLGGLMWEHAWMVLLTLAALLSCWIWHVLPRFGPLLPPMLTSRRSLREHIRAAGGWLASRSDWMALVTPVRGRFWARLAQRHPRTALMSDVERLEYAARLCGLTLSETTRLLAANVDSRRECMYVIRWLMHVSASPEWFDGRLRVRPPDGAR